MSATRYAVAESVEAAVSLLSSDPRARLLAGGYSLLLPKDRRKIAGSLLIDLRKVPELLGIQMGPDGSLQIGAMTTIGAIASHELIRRHFPALAEAAELIGDAQVRNRATLGGSLAVSDPESDLPALILALDASVSVQRQGGSRTIPADQFFTGSQRTALARDEVIASVLFPPQPKRSGAAYEKFKHPATLCALCGVAAAVTLAEKNEITGVRVAATGALNYPMRLPSLEAALLHKSIQNGALSSLPALPNEFTFRDDFFASAEYRRHLLGVLTRRALKRALESAAA